MITKPSSLRLAILPALIATFALFPTSASALLVDVGGSGTGSGNISGAIGATPVIDCDWDGTVNSGDCTEDVASATTITLIATPSASPASLFTGWTRVVTPPGAVVVSTCTTGTTNNPCFVQPLSAGSHTVITAAFPLELITPEVTVEDLEGADITSTEATLHGTVDPNLTPVDTCRFELVKQSDPQGFSSPSVKKVDCVPGPAGIGDGDDPVEVEATAIDLEPNTGYRTRILSSKVGANPATAIAEASPFATDPVAADVTTEAAWSISDLSATLSGKVNPRNSSLTDCHFEYGLGGSFDHSVPCTPTHPGVSEVQRVSLANAKSGTFKLSFEGEQTAPIAYSASAAEVQAALEALPALDPGDVAVEGSPGGPWTISFLGGQGAADVAQMTLDATGLNAAVNEVQQLKIGAAAGQFKLTFGGQQSADVAFNANAATVQAALEALSSIGAGNVAVSGGPGNAGATNPYSITFVTALGGKDVAQLTVANGTAPLSGGNLGVPPATIATLTPGAPAGTGTVATLTGGAPGNAPVPVTAEVHGLSPSSHYEFRLLADNGTGGPQTGDQVSFATRAPVHFPERGYELVSALETNGIAAWPDRSSPGGNHFAYRNVTLPLPGGETGLRNTFVATRRPDGSWSQTYSGPPSPDPFEVGFMNSLIYAGDLSRVVWGVREGIDPDDRNHTQGATDGNDLYLRDLGNGSIAWLSRDPSIPPGTPQTDPANANAQGVVGGAQYVSSDGSRVYFLSERNLLPADATDDATAALYEWDEGELSLVSVKPGFSTGFSAKAAFGGGFFTIQGDGVYGNMVTGNAASPDGRRVAFSVGEGLADQRLYVRIDGAETVEASAQAAPCVPAPSPCPPAVSQPKQVNYWGADKETRNVFFTSSSPLTEGSTAPNEAGNAEDEPAPSDLYRYTVPTDGDPAHGHLVDLTPHAGGAGVNQVLSVSDGGRRIYFLSGAALTGDAKPVPGCDEQQGGAPGGGSAPGPCNLYLAELDGPDDDSAELTLVTSGRILLASYIGSGLSQPQGRQVAANADGSAIAFRSADDLVPGRHTGGKLQAYLYEAERDELSCASCSPTGSTASAGAGLTPSLNATSWSAPAAHVRNVSADGAVFFETLAPLVEEDVNGKVSVYEFRGGRLRLISAGDDPSGAIFGDATAGDSTRDGATVFFASGGAYVPGVPGGTTRIYAARVGGGYEPPLPAPPCTGEDCKPVATAQPDYAAPATAGVAGAGNLSPRFEGRKAKKRCRRGKVRRKGRCVAGHKHKRKAKHRHRRAHRRAAHHDRRNGR